MTASETIPLLARVSGILFHPGAARPLNVVATLVHTRVAVVPRASLPQEIASGTVLDLRFPVGPKAWRTRAVVEAHDDLLASLVLGESPPYGLPAAIFADPAPAARYRAETVLVAGDPWSPVPVRLEIHAGGRTGTYWEVEVFRPEEPSHAVPVAGAPVVQGSRLLGVLDRWAGNRWFVIPAAAIRDSAAVRSAFSSYPGGEEARADEDSVGSRAPELFERLSPEVLEILSNAEGIRRSARSPEIWMEHLIAGLASLPGSAPQQVLHRLGGGQEGLRLLLTGLSGSPLPKQAEYEPVQLDALPPVSTRVARALQAAMGRARGEKAPGISAWHLLVGAAAVSDSPVIQGLEKRGLASAVDDLLRGEAYHGPPADAEAVGGVRYTHDQPSGEPDEEKLGIRREVRVLASLLAARETPLPLSLGLFGDWGSGKSFFMHQLEAEVARLAAQAGRDEQSPYCQGIVQLWFNAWHYIDTNLWASLAAAIFEGIAQKLQGSDGAGSPEKLEMLRATLLARTAHLHREWDDKRERRRKLDDELRRNEDRLARIRDDQRHVEHRLQPAELLKTAYRYALAEPALSRQLDQAVEELGIEHVTSEVKSQLIRMGKLRRRIWVVARALDNRPGYVAALLLGLVLALSGATMLTVFGDRWGLLGLVPGVVVVLGFLTPVLRTVGAVVGSVERAQKAIADSARGEQERVRRALRKRRMALRKAAARARVQEKEASDQLAEVQRQLDRIHPNHQFSEFVRERWQSGDYTRHLGVIARARNDFVALTSHLREMGESQPVALSDGTLLPNVGRIVLYIDDLDRCPEEKVVEVLQAVHLLLAFELFVVVVGVDARWLIHSLRRHSYTFRERREEGLAEEERARWQSTPLNYLEKIFQIPFSLRPMDPAGFGNLIDHLAQSDAASQREPDEDPRGREASVGAARPRGPGNRPAPALPQAAEPAGTGGERAPEGPASGVPDAPRADDGSGEGGEAGRGATASASEAALLAERFALRDWERTFMKEMHPLIPTPRAAKRLLNVYRLIRGTLDAERFEALTASPQSGEYRPVLVLLALLTGYPAEATAVLRDLLKTRPTGSWREYVDALEQRRAPAAGEPGAAAAEPLFDSLEGFEAARWTEMLERVQKVSLPPEQGCEEFVAWAREVGRYSFHSGRVVLSAEPGRSVEAAASRPGGPAAATSGR